MSERPLPPTPPREGEPEQIDAYPFDRRDAPFEHEEADRQPAHGIKLTTFDVFALIVNKMIGSGIYIAPSSVLVLTGNKSTAMWLWVAGFAYTIFSMVIYLGYSAVFPYTGGELVYIDEMSSENAGGRPRVNTGESLRSHPDQAARKRSIWTQVFGDGLLAYTVYAVLFCALFNSSTNALQVGREVLVAVRPQETTPQMDVLRLIGVFSLTILCLVNYWSSSVGRKLNRWVAVLKLVFLVILVIAGAVRTHYRKFEGNGFVECAPVDHSAADAAKAMLLVIFSFEGWENATFVAGEIAPEDQSNLRKGFMCAVAVVGCLYMAIVAVFMYAVPYVPITIQFAPVLFGNSQGAYQAWSVIIAISTLGSMNSIIYTFSRLKQVIGVGNIFPWSHFWSSDSPDLKDHRNYDVDKSPRGGLWLHWIMSVILIAISAGVDSTLESISMPGLIQTYTHCLIIVFISFGAFRLPSRARNLKPTQERTPNSLDRKISDRKWAWQWPLYFLVAVYLLANLMVVIGNVIPPYVSQDGILGSHGWKVSDHNRTLTCTSANPTNMTFGVPITPGRVSTLQGWILPCVSVGMLIIGVIYYYSLLGIRANTISIARIAGVAPEITRSPRYDSRKERVYRFGSRREIEYLPVVSFANTLKFYYLHTLDQLLTISFFVQDNSDDAEPNFWYWALGGQSWYKDSNTTTPYKSMRRRKNILKKRLKSIPMKVIGGDKGTRADSSSEREEGSQDEA